MSIFELFKQLTAKFGSRSDPDVWWPTLHDRTDPREFERVYTNILVTQTQWPTVKLAVDALDRAGLLTAQGLGDAPIESIAECIKSTGCQTRKATTMKTLSAFVISQFQTEKAFCASVTADQLRAIAGIGPETADRILLYTCKRLVFPVDTYCLRVLAHYQIMPAEPTKASEKRAVVHQIKEMVQNQLPHDVIDWQRLHALMQLEGEDLRKNGGSGTVEA